MKKVQIRLYNDFTNLLYVNIEVQEMAAYNILYSEKVSREKADSIIKGLKDEYPNNEFCEFMI